MAVTLRQLILGVAVFTAACAFKGDYDGSELLCTEPDRRCPEGFFCGADNRCLPEQELDGATPTPDGATQQPDATPLTTCEKAAMEPDNDLCVDAIDITVDVASIGGGIFHGDTTGYANHLNPPVIVGCTESPEPGNDAVYRFTAAAGDTLDVTLLTDGGWDGAVYLLDDCSSSATCLGGADDDAGSADHAVIPIAAAGTYYLIVDAPLVAASGCYTFTAALL